MKKIIVFAVLASTLILSGCFGNETASTVESNDNQTAVTPVTPLINSASIVFDDKEYYLKARNSGNVSICSRIKNVSLKKTCETDAKTTASKLEQNLNGTDESYNLQAHASGRIDFCAKIQKPSLKSQCEKDLQMLVKR